MKYEFVDLANYRKSLKPAQKPYKPPGAFMRPIIEWLDRRGHTGNTLCNQRIKAGPFVFFLLVISLIVPPGAGQIALFLVAISVSTWVWLTDLMDGKLARFQQWKLCIEMGIGFFTLDPLFPLEYEQSLSWDERMKMKGITHTGQTIDPVADKLSYAASGLPLLIVSAYMACWWTLAGTIAYELLLFAMRPIKDRLELNDKAAKGPGKIKVNVQWISLLILFVAYIGVNNAWWVISDANLTFAATALFAHIAFWQTGSLLAHLWGAWLSWDLKKAKQMVEEAKAAADSD